MQCTLHICILLHMLVWSRQEVKVSKEDVEIPSHSGLQQRRTVNSYRHGKALVSNHKVSKSTKTPWAAAEPLKALTQFPKRHCALIYFDCTKNITVGGCGILIDCFLDIFVLTFRNSLMKLLHTSWFNNKVIENIFQQLFLNTDFWLRVTETEKNLNTT